MVFLFMKKVFINKMESKYINYSKYWDPNKAGIYTCASAVGVIPSTKDQWCRFESDCTAKAWCDKDPTCTGYGLSQAGIYQASNTIVQYNTYGFNWAQKTSVAPPAPPPPAPKPKPKPLTYLQARCKRQGRSNYHNC